jgi:hypothetical protein
MTPSVWVRLNSSFSTALLHLRGGEDHRIVHVDQHHFIGNAQVVGSDRVLESEIFNDITESLHHAEGEDL